MKTKYPRLILQPGRERSLLHGHPWLFSGAVAHCEGSPEPGELVMAVTADETPLAVGFYNPLTNIAFRCVTMAPGSMVDHNFLRRLIVDARALREKVVPGRTDAYRLINAEGDGLPGLVVDRYGPYLVVSFSTAGADRFHREILDILWKEIKPVAIYERSEGRARSLEGLADRTGPAAGRMPPPIVDIRENDLTFGVDIVSGQKTGFFLDQRINRELVTPLARGARVLNCFSYSGGFSVYAGRGGAAEVTSVDVSLAAGRLSRANWTKNGLPEGDHRVITADIFDYLREDEGRYDLVILDPPAFTKSTKDVARAAAGYKEINMQGIGKLKEGGLLFTFSCSNFIDEALFEKIVLGAIRDRGKMARLLKVLGPGPDHPVNLAHSEGRYLKGLMLSVSCKGGFQTCPDFDLLGRGKNI